MVNEEIIVDTLDTVLFGEEWLEEPPSDVFSRRDEKTDEESECTDTLNLQLSEVSMKLLSIDAGGEIRGETGMRMIGNWRGALFGR